MSTSGSVGATPSTLKPLFARLAYGYFAWRLMYARAPLEELVNQADRAHQDVQAADVPTVAETIEEIVVGTLAVFTGKLKSDMGEVVRYGCAGSAIQIVYSLFENLVALLGEKPGPTVRAGKDIRGEPFSRVLWAARNAFAHQDEWQRKGAVHPAAVESFAILKAIGFQDPANVNVHDLYVAMSGGSTEDFLRGALGAANELANRVIGTTAVPALGPIIRAALVGYLLISILGVKASALFSADPSVKIRLAREGDAVNIPLPAERIGQAVGAGAIAAFALRWESVKRLSATSARPFRELESRLDAWWKQFEVLHQTDIESPRYLDDLSILCSRVDQIRKALTELPDPLSLLAVQNGVTGEEDARAFIDKLLMAYSAPTVPDPGKSLDLTALFDPTGELFPDSTKPGSS
jgi:hypothetical protein